MKRKLPDIFIIILIAISASLFVACSSNTSESIVTYTIFYTDDSGSHKLNVEKGELYQIESIPAKDGYNFVGLYDSEFGGTQYVGSNGVCISPFNDSTNIVLYPHFEAQTYKFLLDYQGAYENGNSSFNVVYGETMPELPKNLVLEHYDFVGWFTAEKCGGVMVADNTKILPTASVVYSDIYKVDVNGYVVLYAGFKLEKFTVIFNYGNNLDSEEQLIEYGTNISDVVTETRYNGKAVLTWSKIALGGEVFDGKIVDGMILYAVEWAPYIEFDSNGGTYVNTIIKRENTDVLLPVSECDNKYFVGWQTTQGQLINEIKMPEYGIKLIAMWQTEGLFAMTQTADCCVVNVKNHTKSSVFKGEQKYTLDIPEELRNVKGNCKIYVEIKAYCNASLQYRSNKEEARVTIKGGFNSDIEEIKKISAIGSGWGALSVDPSYGNKEEASGFVRSARILCPDSNAMDVNLKYEYVLSFKEHTNWAGGTHAVNFSAKFIKIEYSFCLM